MSIHSDDTSDFRANQFLLLLLKPICLVSEEAANTNFIVFSLTRPELEQTIYRKVKASRHHYITDVFYSLVYECQLYGFSFNGYGT